MKTLRFRHFSFAVLTISISIGCGIVLTEVFFRAYVYSAKKKEILQRITSESTPILAIFNKSLIQFSREFGYEYKPDKEIVGAFVGPDGKLLACDYYEINRWGNFERPEPKWNENDFKILILGDSFTAISFDGMTWPSHFAKEIRILAKNRNISVLNLGRDGYGILQMVDLAEKKVAELKPDLILFAFITDDLTRMRFWRQTFSQPSYTAWYVLDEPNELPRSKGAQVAQFLDSEINRTWCEKNKGKMDSIVIPRTITAYKEDRKFELTRKNINVFQFKSYLLEFIRYGRNELEKRKKVDYLLDLQFSKKIEALNNSKTPYFFIHIPTYEELKHRKLWIYTAEGQSALVEQLQSLTHSTIHNLAPYMPLNSSELESLPLSMADTHPSRKGISFYGKAMAHLINELVQIKPK